MATEKEKREQGVWHDPAHDAELTGEYIACQNMLYDYNMVRINEKEKRSGLLRGMLGKVGNNCTVLSPFRCDFGYNVMLGDNVYINYGTVLLDVARIEIGSNVFIGPQCGIYTAIHPLAVRERNMGLEKGGPVTIGDNVWIGGNVTILPGVTIGEGAVVGAGSVVTRDVPPFTVVAGNPARLIKKIE